LKSCQWHVHWNHSALQLPVTDLCNFAHRPLHLWTVYNSESGSLQGNSGVLATLGLGNYVDTRFWVVVCTVDSIRVGYNCLWTRNCLEAPFRACLTVSHKFGKLRAELTRYWPSDTQKVLSCPIPVPQLQATPGPRLLHRGNADRFPWSRSPVGGDLEEPRALSESFPRRPHLGARVSHVACAPRLQCLWVFEATSSYDPKGRPSRPCHRHAPVAQDSGLAVA
jgi:hypothetical protein